LNNPIYTISFKLARVHLINFNNLRL